MWATTIWQNDWFEAVFGDALLEDSKPAAGRCWLHSPLYSGPWRNLLPGTKPHTGVLVMTDADFPWGRESEREEKVGQDRKN